MIGFGSWANKKDATLLRATRTHRDEMRAWVDRYIGASGGTNFQDAIAAVIDVLRASASAASGCNRVVLF